MPKTIEFGGFSGCDLRLMAAALVDQAKEQDAIDEFKGVLTLALSELTGKVDP